MLFVFVFILLRLFWSFNNPFISIHIICFKLSMNLYNIGIIKTLIYLMKTGMVYLGCVTFKKVSLILD